MSIFSKLDKSSDLSSEMAEKTGVDLKARIEQSPETAGREMRSIAIRCAACEQHDGCADLLAENESLDTPPDYCLNKEALGRMKRR